MHFYYPKSNIFYTSIDKNANTTLKNYFTAIEQLSHQPGTVLRDFGKHGFEVHKSDHRHKVNLDKPKAQHVSVLVLRNPYSRLASGWVNKFLYAQGDYSTFNRYRHESFANVGSLTPMSIRFAFEEFVKALSNSEYFLHSNVHWRPQSAFFISSSDYSIVTEVSELHRLPKMLEQKGLDPRLLSECPLPYFNKSASAIFDFLWSSETKKLATEVYRQDFELLSSAGISQLEPTVRRVEDLPTSLEDSEIQHILNTRLESADAFAQSILGSKTWRLTTPFRKFAGELEGLIRTIGQRNP